MPLVKNSSLQDLHRFFLFLGQLTEAKIPLIQALDILSSQQYSKSMKKIIHRVQNTLNQGRSFYEAFSDPLVHTRLEAACLGGTLSQTLVSLSAHFDFILKSKQSFKKIISYPILVLMLLLCIIFCAGIWFIPSLIPLFDKPPESLVTFMYLSHKLPYVILILLGVGCVLSKKKQYLFYIPVIGSLIKQHSRMIFLLTLYPMTEEKIPLQKALSIQNISIDLEQGVAKGLSQLSQLSVLSLQLIALGEETGNLSLMLKTAYLFEKEAFERSFEACLHWIGPLMTLVMAGILLLIIFAIIFPMYDHLSF